MRSAMDLALDAIKVHEGLRLKPYTCPAGKLTIGYGRNLEDNGLTHEEAEILLRHDLSQAELDAISFLGLLTWYSLSERRKAVLINMSFNLGLTTLSKFTRFKVCLQSGDWPGAAVEMLDSKWASQVGHRATELAEEMRRG